MGWGNVGNVWSAYGLSSLFNIETIVCAVVFIAFIYFAIIHKRKKKRKDNYINSAEYADEEEMTDEGVLDFMGNNLRKFPKNLPDTFKKAIKHAAKQDERAFFAFSANKIQKKNPKADEQLSGIYNNDQGSPTVTGWNKSAFRPARAKSESWNDFFTNDPDERELMNDSISRKSRRPRNPKISTGERTAKRIVEKIFNKSFVSIRPNWLVNPTTGNPLEIDIFNPSITTPIGKGIGFEADGRQHSEYVPFFHKRGAIDLLYQMKKDKWKDLKCRDMGVLLIRIPHNIDVTDYELFIKRRLRDKGMGQYVDDYERRRGS